MLIHCTPVAVGEKVDYGRDLELQSTEANL